MVLASGSGGNATYLEKDGTKVLIDCGITYRQIDKRLQDNNLNLNGLKAILITHEHNDHIKGLDVLLKKIDHVTCYMTKDTFYGIPSRMRNNIDETKISFITPYDPIFINELEVLPISVSHDSSDAVGYVFKQDNKKIVYITDIGYLPKRDFEYLIGADMYIFESNYDVTMLFTSKRPFFLKQRIDSVKGHMSNADSAYNLAQLVRENTKHIVLAHRSRECNTNELILSTYEEVFAGYDLNINDFNVVIATQDIPTKLFLI
jgi:phosphoribosyl 1,2-cyclic phosphodiesterase